MGQQYVTVDGNEACAMIAHKTNEVIAIYPITPASPMGELADGWAAQGRKNIFGTVPQVIEMQSEGGAAGAVHGSLQAGALTTTFTASQGLLLMLPNMFKIAGELTPTVFHIAARTVATHALSIFADHSDVMAARTTGWAMLASNTVQEAHDFALIAQAATLQSRVPFLHFFDGFRTSHEINKITPIDDEQIRALVDPELVLEHRRRSLDPDRPVLRGSAQNPDVFFQAREACNPFYDAVPAIVADVMAEFERRIGRAYRPFDYVGAEDADRVIVIMGSGAGAAEEAVKHLNSGGNRVGLLKVRLFRPFSSAHLVEAMPETVGRIAVLDRTKEPGAAGEPLYQDVITALVEQWNEKRSVPAPFVSGGRYGLSSKEFTPAMVCAIFDELKRDAPKRRFTVGIVDDVTRLSLKWDPDLSTERDDETRAVFYGLGSDGTVGANKNSVKIIGEHTDLHAQGYFVYDSRKSGATTISHLRFGPRPINSSYLIRKANFVACHQFHFLDRMDVLGCAEPGSSFLLNSPFGPDDVWDRLPQEVQRDIIEKELKLHVVDAYRVARDVGLPGRINSVMQVCFFAISGVLPMAQALEHIRDAIRKTYGKRGEVVVRRNLEAVDAALEAMHEVKVPDGVTSDRHRLPPVPETSPDFVKRVTAMMIEGKGDYLPVSALPADGTFPTATSRFEKRSIAEEIPIWDPSICIDCGLCAIVCPHAAIRSKVFDPADLNGTPEGYQSKDWKGKEYPGKKLTIQVAPDDCTGCGICVDTCPARSKESVKHKAINMEPKLAHLEREQARFECFIRLPELRRADVKLDAVNGSQLLQPLFEFSSACAGCGETPYLKLMTQLFGDRMLVANATGCSSIYGGNLPVTPWSQNAEGRGPAWSNSLFEDNAEFGLGMRLAQDAKLGYAQDLIQSMRGELDDLLVDEILHCEARTEEAIEAQRDRVAALRDRLQRIDSPRARDLEALADAFISRSVWIVGGDGWAYDIGFGGLDHVLASGRNVNILVLDTEVYSNTGGQASKATPRAAVAKFAAGGKPIGKKDLGLLAMAYGNVYVAHIAIGANPRHTIRAFLEAEAYDGPSLIIAYSHCIAHGIDMSTSMAHQKEAADCGYWPLFTYDPRQAHLGERPLKVERRKGKTSFREFAAKEARFAMLKRSNPEQAERLIELAQKDIDERWRFYEQMVGVERTVPDQEQAVEESATAGHDVEEAREQQEAVS